MLKKLLLSVAIILASSAIVFAQQGALKGKITDKKTKEPIPFANVVLEAGGKQISGATTDFDGFYTIKPIPPGKYDVKTSFVGFKGSQVTGVIISSDKITFQTFELESTTESIVGIEVVEYKNPLIEKDGGSAGGTVTSDQIAKMATRTASGVAATVGGVYSNESNGEMNVRGARADGTVTYIDGMKVQGGSSSSVPAQAIEQVTVITGGLPAQYGDATGGVINITTKGPSREWGGGVEYLTSEPFDAIAADEGYNLLGFSVQGPLILGKDKQSSSSLLGFFLSGELNAVKDGNPSAIGVYKVNNAKLSELETNPIRPTGQGFGYYKNSEYIKKADLDHTKSRPNVADKGINLSGKLDVRTTKTTNLTFGGNMDISKTNRNVVGNTNNFTLFNYKNNPEEFIQSYRLFGRFTQRFNSSDSGKKNSLIKNVYYSVQADYSMYKRILQDAEHKDNLFNYGYVGKFKTYNTRSYEDSTTGYLGNTIKIHNGFKDTLFTFEAGNQNPELSSYTSQYYQMYDRASGGWLNKDAVQTNGGLLNGDEPSKVYGLWDNTGTIYDSYSITDNRQMSFNASGSADVKNHAISIGFNYEQRNYRQVSYNPRELWTLGHQLANKHIAQLDKSAEHTHFISGSQDTIWYDRKISKDEQAFFDYNLRNKVGFDVNGADWIDVDNYDPSTFSIDMFSADELFREGNRRMLVSYFGYDYKGKKLSNKPSFDDFFTAKDEYGNYKREIGAFEPIYMAGYITDKFAFNDLIFNIGVRVDRFDANQKVLKDQYSLFETKKVSEVTNLGAHPSSMKPSYVVYVNDLNTPTSILGYRNGSTWYNAQGAVIQDPTILYTPNGIAPYLVDPKNTTLSSKAFQDYEPQVNVMPRISFSFPISDEALFFAHYDVLTKRPTTGLRLDPTDYYFIYAMGNDVLSNPDLKPEKTIDYELGFQQKLSNTSSLKFSTYYRELRNMVQVVRINGAYPVSYNTWGNYDFGTVKGLTIAYDLRRTGNVWLKASYTLQFADGTGSSTTSGLNLVNSGQPNLRTTSSLDYDQRHAIQIVADYRFADGKDYTGPVLSRVIKGTDKVKETQVLANTGVNVTFIGGSGTPYSKQSNIFGEALGSGTSILQGQINGSRLPGQFRIDARIDKDISFTIGGKKEGSKAKELEVNVYVQILNVLNTKNVLSVYRATGNPDDDGYLTAAQYQKDINSQLDQQAFREQYQVKINDPDNYSMPRILRLGLSLNF